MATFEMTFGVTIGFNRLKGFKSIKIKSSVDSMSDTASIELPGAIQNVSFETQRKIKRGMVVEIKLGYNGNNKTEFLGYVRSISANSPCVVELEDSMYLFRKEIEGKVFLNATVEDIVNYVCEQIDYKSNINLGGLKYDKFVIQNGATGYDVLKKVKEQYGLGIYIKDNKLVATLKYIEKNGDVVYDFARNVRESNLQWVEEEDVKVEVRVRGVGVDNKITKTVKSGVAGGEIRKLTDRVNVTDEATLKKIASEELKRLTYKGFRGELTGWGVPFCDVGYSAKVIDATYKDREGVYFVKGVEVSFDINGFQRKVTLGQKLG